MVDNLSKVEVNISAMQEHVLEVERIISTVKEQGILIINTLSYYCLPAHIIMHIVYFVIMWLYTLPSLNGISMWYSPREIVSGCHMDFKKH